MKICGKIIIVAIMISQTALAVHIEDLHDYHIKPDNRVQVTHTIVAKFRGHNLSRSQAEFHLQKALVNDPSDKVRKEAAIELGKLGDPSAATVGLLGFFGLFDSSPSVVLASEQTIKNFTVYSDPIYEALGEIETRSNEPALVKNEAHEAAAALKHRSSSLNGDLMEETIKALTKISPKNGQVEKFIVNKIRNLTAAQPSEAISFKNRLYMRAIAALKPDMETVNLCEAIISNPNQSVALKHLATDSLVRIIEKTSTESSLASTEALIFLYKETVENATQSNQSKTAINDRIKALTGSLYELDQNSAFFHSNHPIVEALAFRLSFILMASERDVFTEMLFSVLTKFELSGFERHGQGIAMILAEKWNEMQAKEHFPWFVKTLSREDALGRMNTDSFKALLRQSADQDDISSGNLLGNLAACFRNLGLASATVNTSKPHSENH